MQNICVTDYEEIFYEIMFLGKNYLITHHGNTPVRPSVMTQPFGIMSWMGELC